MTQTETWTVGRLLTWTTDYLRKKGSESARLDAEVLLAHARQCQRIELYTAFDQEPDESVKAAFREMVVRRAEGTPVAYLVGHKEFYSLDFRVNPDCLIPRPETEHLVVAAIDAAKAIAKVPASASGATSRTLTVADICTGSGCVAIAIAKHIPNAQVFASDISESALAVATSNAAQHSLSDRIQFFSGDLLDAIPADKTVAKFDIIVSNPPYISQSEYEQLSKSVREFEPKAALLSGATGLEISERLIAQANERIAEGGFMIIETSPMLAKQLAEVFDQHSGWTIQPTIKDLQGHARIVTARRIG
jgi:release factor glutamine methyltransferase